MKVMKEDNLGKTTFFSWYNAAGIQPYF